MMVWICMLTKNISCAIIKEKGVVVMSENIKFNIDMDELAEKIASSLEQSIEDAVEIAVTDAVESSVESVVSDAVDSIVSESVAEAIRECFERFDFKLPDGTVVVCKKIITDREIKTKTAMQKWFDVAFFPNMFE